MQFGNYRITRKSVGPFFDVEEKTIVNKGKSNEREDWKVVAYGLPFKDLLFTIAYEHLKSRDVTYNLSEFLIELEKEINIIKAQFDD